MLYVSATADGIDSIIYLYDNNKSLKQEIEFLTRPGNDIGASYYYHYESGRLSTCNVTAWGAWSTDTVGTLSRSLVYNSAGQVAKVRYFDAGSDRDSMVYNNNGQLTELFHISPDPTLSYHRIFTFEQGNPVKVITISNRDGGALDTSSTTYKYDNKKCFHRSVKVLFYIVWNSLDYIPANNPTESVTTYSNSIARDTRTWSYTYNNEGYPVSIRSTMASVNANGTPSTMEVAEKRIYYLPK